MPLKRALLASAATPILALALNAGVGWTAAAAAEINPTNLTSGTMLVAQADSSQQDEELRKRRQRQQGDQQSGEQPKSGQDEAPQQAEQPRKKKQQEQQQAQPEKKQPEQQQAQPEKKQPEQQQAQPKKQAEPQSHKQAEPKAQPKQAEPDQQAQPKQKPEPQARKQQADTQSEKPARKKPEQQAEPGKQNAKQAEPDQKPASAGKPKANPEEKTAEPQRNRKASPDDTGSADAKRKAKGKEGGSDTAGAAADEGTKPAVRKKNAAQPQSEQAQPEQKPSEAPANRNAVAPSGNDQQPTGNAQRKLAPSQQQGQTATESQQGEAAKPAARQLAPEGGNAQQQAQPANQNQPGNQGQPVQIQSQEGAPKIAPLKSLNDQPAQKAVAPASADAKPQLLDVPNGAPVLDSAKDREEAGGVNREQRRQERAQRRQERQQRQQQQPIEIQSVTAVEGERIQEVPTFQPPENVTVEKRVNNRYVVNVDNRTYIENNDYDRISHRAEDVYYERLPQGNYRQVVVRPNGVRVVTIRNRYGDILQRSRIRNGEETVLIYVPDYERDHRDVFYEPVDLPPIRLTEPVDEYILVAGDATPDQYVTFLEKPPIEPIEQVYTLDQVRYSARLRDIMPRIDLDTITFPTGSAEIQPSQEDNLQALANAINDILKDDPGQVFLVEGHTDAVGSAQSNLILSDQRAESVAAALTQDFGVAPENLVTQGYGEQYLKVETQEASRINRRVAIRRITPLIRPTAQN